MVPRIGRNSDRGKHINLMKKDTIRLSTTRYKKAIILALFFSILIPLYAASTKCEWTGIEKIVAVGDIHGDYDNFIKILKAVGIVDDALHWKAGKTHFVQTGDIIDRGPEAKKAFNLLMRLEKEAEQAGGRVHFLIGNHEEMNITGIAFDYAGYVTVKQFISFLPEKFKKKKEKELRNMIGDKDLPQAGEGQASDNNLKPYWEKVIKTDKDARKQYTNNFNDKYGKWILEHNAVIKINDVIFVHGGISKKYSTWKLKDINDLLREELTYLRRYLKGYTRYDTHFQPRIIYKSDGPLWYRGLALQDEEGFKQQVSDILNNLSAKYIVMAHTPRTGSRIISEEFMNRFEGRIWIIDTGISEYYGGFLSALIIENGNFSVWGARDEE